MLIKEKFDLIKGVQNYLTIPSTELKSISVENGPRKISRLLELMSSRISHYTKDKIFKLIDDPKERENIKVVNLPNYILPVSYNLPTKNIILNLSPFGVDDILTTKPGPQNLYAMLVYGIVFSEIVSGRYKISEKYFTVISNYILSILIRAFGKEYGLLGSFSREIPKLKFIVNLYILTSFFGVSGNEAYKRASVASAFNYRDLGDNLNKYDFKNINDFILSLSELGAMPNLNRHIFTAKILKLVGANFIPALEDLSRFVSIIATSEIKGSNIVATYLSKYNEKDFNSILEISRVIFKK